VKSSQLGVKDTSAWRIVRQLINHSWGADQELDENEFLNICSNFYHNGGSWELLLDGDMSHVSILETCIEASINNNSIVV
jgi:hypothetical protein